MIIVQKFHSIDEIDPEFIRSLEDLLTEELLTFDGLKQAHNEAPVSDTFTYFLFFGPTQNAPIGFSQLRLRQVPHQNLIPWWKKFFFWKKDYLHWKEATWKIADGSSGHLVFNPKFAKSIKEKMSDLIKEYEQRDDIVSEQILSIKGLEEKNHWSLIHQKWSKEILVLDPFQRSTKTYQDYLETLTDETKRMIKDEWMKLHKINQVVLGDYPQLQEVPTNLHLAENVRSKIIKLKSQILTFEKNGQVLGCIIFHKGRSGNVFIEPIPFENEDSTIVQDFLYLQYGLIKFFEINEAKKLLILKDGKRLQFADKNQLIFFQNQGIHFKYLTQTFYSRITNLRDLV